MKKDYKVLLFLIAYYFAIELSAFAWLQPESWSILVIGLLWSVVFGGIIYLLPKHVDRLVFFVSAFSLAFWCFAEISYEKIFGKLMWLADTLYVSEGVIFFDTFIKFYTSPLWWFVGLSLLGISVLTFIFWPLKEKEFNYKKIVLVAVSVLALSAAKMGIQEDFNKHYINASAYYEEGGYIDMVMRNLYHWQIEPHLITEEAIEDEINDYFALKEDSFENEMTGLFEDKNVIIVLMEAIDDWQLTPNETPTILKMMDEAWVFENFYTPFYGTTRSINTETSINGGIFLPTQGQYFFDYIDGSFNQSLAHQFKEEGYSAEVYHHNYKEFYSRDRLVPAMGYDAYNSYVEDCEDEYLALNDEYVFDDESMKESFFREGKTLNFLISQAAHLPYTYDDPMSEYAFLKYPEYKGMFKSEEEDVIRVKTKLVDDLFARLLKELEQEGQLDNTIIVAVCDHYPYGYSNKEEILAFEQREHLLSLENTPLFIWGKDLEATTFNKTCNTSDLLPTLLNLFNIESDYDYIGNDIFDPNYAGYAYFADGSFVYDGLMVEHHEFKDEKNIVLENKNDIIFSEEWLEEISLKAIDYTYINNLLVTSGYYKGK